MLGKIKQLKRSGDWDVIVVDGPAAGHAITFLTAAAGLHDAVRSGPVRTQADDVLELLRDPDRSQVVLVTLPETTPVNEVVQTAYALEDRVGARLARWWSTTSTGSTANRSCPIRPTSISPATRTPPCSGGPAFRRSRRRMQDEEIERLRAELALEQWHLPQLPVSGMGPAEVAVLAASIKAGP